MMTCLCLSVIHRGNVKQRQCYVPCLATMWTKRNNISIHITLSGTWRQFNTFDRLNAACLFPLLPLGAVLRFSGRRCDARGRFRSIFFFFFLSSSFYCCHKMAAHSITIVSQTDVLCSHTSFFYKGGDDSSLHTQLVIARTRFKMQVNFLKRHCF